MRAAIATDGERALTSQDGPPYQVIIDEPRAGSLRTTVKLLDRGAVVTYRLGGRGKGHRWAFGFTEHAVEADGSTSTTPVSAAEVMAVAREVGREDDVIAMVEAALPYATPRNVRRLRAELAAGRNLDRVALPKIQTAILERLAEGLTLSELSDRGGFVSAATRERGRHDTSWLQRRAGLIPHVCRTGKRRTARTADYHVFVMLVRAVGGDPVDFGV
jgi:hypothetical protein